jgi:hypothetical protein
MRTMLMTLTLLMTACDAGPPLMIEAERGPGDSTPNDPELARVALELREANAAKDPYDIPEPDHEPKTED